MNKNELIDAAVSDSGVSKADVTKVVDSVLGSITASMKKGDKVAIAGFGNFELRARAARTGRNPQTGEALQVKASNAVGFKPAKALKDAVN